MSPSSDGTSERNQSAIPAQSRRSPYSSTRVRALRVSAPSSTPWGASRRKWTALGSSGAAPACASATFQDFRSRRRNSSGLMLQGEASLGVTKSITALASGTNHDVAWNLEFTQERLEE